MKIKDLIFNGDLLQLDEKSYSKNLQEANTIAENYQSSRPEIKMGDFVLRKTGVLERVTVNFDDSIQLGADAYHYGFHINKDSEVSYSGSCGLDLLNKKELELMDIKEIGRYWFFNVETGPGKDQSIHFDMPTRVWKEK